MYVGIDLGTSSVKVSLLDGRGNIIASATEKYPLYTPREGYNEQNPDDWWEQTVVALKKLDQKAGLKGVKAVSFSGQMHGMVCLDKDDKVIRPALLWNDQRTEKQTDYLNETIGIQKLVEATANRAVTGFTAPKVMWLKENEPENFKRIAKIMLPKDYVAYRISGVFATDVSDASGTLYFDVKNRKWSDYMLSVLGINEGMLPKVYESSDVVGLVTKEASALTGLPLDAKVVIGGGDQAVGAVGTGTVKGGSASISLGTSGVIFVASDSFKEEKNGALHNFCHANGGYHYMGVTLAAAYSYGWIAETLGIGDLSVLEKEIAELGIDDVVFTPYLCGERSPINAPSVKGSFYGLTSLTKRANLAKAVMEGVAFSLKDCLEVIRAAGVKVDKARVIGGGSRSDEWLKILADVLQVEICRVNTSDGGALGAGILAMVGDGLYKDVFTACDDIIKDECSFLPDASRAAKYEEKFKVYKKLQAFSLEMIKK